MDTKMCWDCDRSLSVDRFYPYRDGSGRYHGRCKDCRRIGKQTRRTEDRRAERLRGQYGMTLDDYNALLDKQGGRCAICETTEAAPGRDTFAVDHDHKCCPASKTSCGKCIRGLLCDRCNRNLGVFEGWVEPLSREIISYLQP